MNPLEEAASEQFLGMQGERLLRPLADGQNDARGVDAQDEVAASGGGRLRMGRRLDARIGAANSRRGEGAGSAMDRRRGLPPDPTQHSRQRPAPAHPQLAPTFPLTLPTPP